MDSPSTHRNSRFMTYVIGGFAIVSVGLLVAYVITKTPKKRKRKEQVTRSKKQRKFTVILNQNPIDIHLVMETMDGFNACVAADKKNQHAKLKYGAKLLTINDTQIVDSLYEDIIDKIQEASIPIKLCFKENDDLCSRWSTAHELKEESNQKYRIGEYEEAIKILNKAILLHPTNKVYYSKRIFLSLKTRDLDIALEDCRIIRELDPTSSYVEGHYLRGLVLIEIKRYKLAAAAFQTVIKLSDNYQRAEERLNQCLNILFGEVLTMEKYHFVDQPTKDLVNGYIRISQKMFDEKDAYYNIQFGINQICAIFLYINDKGAKKKYIKR